ncbi:divergent polysaccharide deacetylase family protein [Pontiella sp.]|uniref:divergent polysaccharide deacetylase family protein n=1 Tax=Pontiella sp. TaxID=2837462 RepID=UPI003569E443
MRLLKVSLVLVLLLGGFAAEAKKIFLVIDDAGLALHETQQFLEIPIPMTIAVLPHQKQTKEVCIAIGRDEQKEIILHQPMEAYNGEKKTGPGAIMNTTSPSEIRKILDRNFRSVRGAVGMNNHMGSKVTENPELIREVLRFCKAHEMFFLDSKTAFNSQVPTVAAEAGMHVEERHVFLDINQNRDFIRMTWGHAVNQAKENGYVIVIGHIWSKESAAAIRDSYETLLNQGYTFHKLSELYE